MVPLPFFVSYILVPVCFFLLTEVRDILIRAVLVER